MSNDVEVLRKAMEGWGTDEATLIKVIANRTNQQRQAIKAQYKATYGRDLIEDPRFPYQKSQSQNAINVKKRPMSSKINYDLGVVNEKNLEKRRQNYERPWAVPVSTKPK